MAEDLLKKGARVYKGHIVSPRSEHDYLDLKDGCLMVDGDGKILSVTREDELSREARASMVDFGEKLIIPGFVDMHVHLPQVTQTGRSGQHLLKWLEKYIFPAEARFKDVGYAERIARWFFDELLRNGTTTASVFTTIHKEATDAAFSVAQELGNRVIMGKVLMDRNCPAELTETVSGAIDASLELYERWHDQDHGRLKYAFIPRFAVTSSHELLEETGKVWQQSKGAYLHTHLAESHGEVELVKKLFPDARSYVDVYQKNQLFGDRTIFAHSIHLDDKDLSALAGANCSLAHCPSSNFFLKSGVFQWQAIKDQAIRFGLGSDVAAGPEMTMFQIMKDANYIQPRDWLTPTELFYRATLGGAIALGLEEETGSLSPGKDADFIIVDPTRRNAIARDILSADTEDILSSLVFLGDDRCVEATYIRGKAVYSA